MQRDAVESGASNQRPVAPREADPSPPCSSPEGTALRQLSATWRAEADKGEENARKANSAGLTYTAVMSAGMAVALREKADELDAVLARLPHQPELGWRPIATAPKDGTEVLVAGNGWMAFGSWHGDRNGHRWWTRNCFVGGRPLIDHLRSEPPTHWLPHQEQDTP